MGRGRRKNRGVCVRRESARENKKKQPGAVNYLCEETKNDGWFKKISGVSNEKHTNMKEKRKKVAGKNSRQQAGKK